MLKATKLWLLSACAIFIVSNFLSSCKAENKVKEHDLACKLMYIQRTLIGADINTIKSEIISFVNSDKYEVISDVIGRKKFKEAFEVTREIISNHQKGDNYKAGYLTGKGMTVLVEACLYYRFEECKNFIIRLSPTGKSEVEAKQVFIAINKLADCGEKLWFSHR